MNKTEIVAILKAVLERTYVTVDEEHLMAQEGLMEHDETPKSESERTLFDGALDLYRQLAQTYGVDTSEGAVIVRRVEYEMQKKAFEDFMAQNGHVIDYIAALASGSRKKVPTPSEDVVFETLRRLRVGIIQGPSIDVDGEGEPEHIHFLLEEIVSEAICRHAKRIGETPPSYFFRVESGNQGKSIQVELKDLIKYGFPGYS